MNGDSMAIRVDTGDSVETLWRLHGDPLCSLHGDRSSWRRRWISSDLHASSSWKSIETLHGDGKKRVYGDMETGWKRMEMHAKPCRSCVETPPWRPIRIHEHPSIHIALLDVGTWRPKETPRSLDDDDSSVEINLSDSWRTVHGSPRTDLLGAPWMDISIHPWTSMETALLLLILLLLLLNRQTRKLD